MSRNFKVYLEDIIHSIHKISRYVSETDLNNLKKDEKSLDAIIKNLEVIGEASKKIPEDIKSKCSEIEWKKISGLRDILIHEYFEIDLEIIKDILKNKIPLLEIQIKKIIESL